VKFAPAVVESDAETTVDAAVLAARTEAVEKERMLEQGESLIVAKDAPGAQAAFEKINQRWPGSPRAVYGLAVTAMMQQDPDRAKALFQSLTRAVKSDAPIAPGDAGVVAWAHVYLGRFDDLDDNRPQALAEYRLALAVPGAPVSARQAAQGGVQKAFQQPIDPNAWH
jgi:thioredoxin-like negative regulator of GroEL